MNRRLHHHHQQQQPLCPGITETAFAGATARPVSTGRETSLSISMDSVRNVDIDSIRPDRRNPANIWPIDHLETQQKARPSLLALRGMACTKWFAFAPVSTMQRIGRKPAAIPGTRCFVLLDPTRQQATAAIVWWQ
mmetsp:Transcript_29598/g.63431  ORF Transcript_29598/g.63431 Transcript_29598/m.63431 type:complete len:136 (+) Transcript_29598:1032-1439(+)